MKLCFSQVQQLCALALNCPPSQIFREARLEEDLGADSFGRATLAAQLEDAWGVSIPDALFIKMTTLAQILEYLEQHSAEQKE